MAKRAPNRPLSANVIHAYYTMSYRLRRLLSDGFADLGVLDPDLPLALATQEIVRSLGAVALADPEDLRVSRAGTKGVNTYGGNYGLQALPLHTDLAHWHYPPRYIMLRCIIGSAAVQTTVLHRRDLEQQVPATLMKRALFSPRRRLEGKMYLLHMLAGNLFRWDQLFLEPKNTPAVEAKQRMLEATMDQGVTQFTLEEPGRTLLLDNWQVLHGRSWVPTSESARRLERMYLEEATNGNEDPA